MNEFECKKKNIKVFIFFYIVVVKVFYIDGLIYEWKLIGSVIYCLEFKMLMKLMFYILYMLYLFKLFVELLIFRVVLLWNCYI